MLNLKPVKCIPETNNIPSCGDDAIASAAGWFGRDNRFMFANSWSFALKPAEPDVPLPLTDRLVFPRPSLDYLQAYHGIRLAFTKRRENKSDAALFWDVLEEQTDAGYPVVAVFDIFHTPWSPYFEQLHARHFGLVVGVDAAAETLFVTDAFYGTIAEPIGFALFNQSCDEFGLFGIAEPPLARANWRPLLEETLCSKQGTDLLASSIRDEKAFAAAYAAEGIPVAPTELELKPVIIVLMEFSLNLRRYAWFLDEIHRLSGRHLFAETADQLRKTAVRWEMIRLQMVKIALSTNRREDREKLGKSILRVVEMKEAALTRLASWLREGVAHA